MWKDGWTGKETGNTGVMQYPQQGRIDKRHVQPQKEKIKVIAIKWSRKDRKRPGSYDTTSRWVLKMDKNDIFSKRNSLTDMKTWSGRKGVGKMASS